MKRLCLVSCLLATFLSKTLAQRPIEAPQALLFEGRVVRVADYVMAIRIMSSSRVYITLGKWAPDSCVTVILSGDGAYKNAMMLKKRMIAEVKGRIEIINGKPWITITDFRRLKIPNCKCLLPDKNPDVVVDAVAFPNEKEMFKKQRSKQK